MAEIVLVHGIAQEQRSADTLESTWLPSLAGGVRAAGHPEAADRIWRDARPGDARMAFYGDLFRRADQQGDTVDLATAEQRELFETLLAEVLTQAATRAGDERDRREAQRALTVAHPDQQGLGAATRPLLNALLRIGPFARLGLSTAERLVKALRQVTIYLTDDTVRAAAQQRVLDLLGPDTRAVVAHSLGTVVAYEALHRLDHPVPLLVTMGSPLGMRTVVYERLRPQPAAVPAGLRRWVNVADPDDLVAADLHLTRAFPGTDGVLESHWTIDNGGKPHEATHYLTKPAVGTPVAAALSPTSNT